MGLLAAHPPSTNAASTAALIHTTRCGDKTLTVGKWQRGMCREELKAYSALRKVRLSNTTGISPTSTSVKAGKAASPKRSSRASW